MLHFQSLKTAYVKGKPSTEVQTVSSLLTSIIPFRLIGSV